MANAYFAPQARGYPVPDISKLLYEGIGNLPQNYYTGQTNAQNLAMQQAFPQGLDPYVRQGPNGPYIDVYSAYNDLAKVGGANVAMPLLKSLAGMQYAGQQNQAAQRLLGDQGGGVEPPLPQGFAPPGGAAQPSSHNTASPTSNTLPGQQSALTGQPPEPQGGMDYLAGLAGEAFPGKDASAAINFVAKQMGVRPDQTLSGDQIRAANTYFKVPQIARLVRPGVASDVEAAQPAPSGSSEDTTPVTQPTSAVDRGVSGGPGPAPEPAVPARPVPTTSYRQGQLGPTPTPAPPAPTGAMATFQQPQLPPDIVKVGLKAQAMRMLANRAAASPDEKLGEQSAKTLDGLAKQLEDDYNAKREDYFKRNMPTGAEMEARRSAPEIGNLERTKKLAEGQAASDVEDAKSINHASIMAGTQLNDLEVLRNLVDQKNYYSGPMSEIVKLFKAGEWLFGGDRSALSGMEMARKGMANMELQAIRDLGTAGLGRILRTEIQSVKNTIPTLDMSPESVRKLIVLNMRTRQLALKAQELLDDNNGVADGTFRKNLRNWVRDNPLISKQEMENPKLLAPPRIRNPEDFDRLGVKPGDPMEMQDRNGVWRIKIRPRSQ